MRKLKAKAIPIRDSAAFKALLTLLLAVSAYLAVLPLLSRLTGD